MICINIKCDNCKTCHVFRKKETAPMEIIPPARKPICKHYRACADGAPNVHSMEDSILRVNVHITGKGNNTNWDEK